MTEVNKVVQRIDLVGEINTKFALDCEADNKIAICTNSCIYVLTSTLSPVETKLPLPLHKQVILAPTKLLNFKLLENILPLKDGPVIPEILLQAVLDHTLVPTANIKPSYLIFWSAKWSPKGISRSGSCYLATLCHDHRLVLHEEKNGNWVPVIDISETLPELHKIVWENEAMKNERIAQTSARSRASESQPATKSFISGRKVLYDARKADAEIAKQKRRIHNIAATGIMWINNMFSISSSAGSYKWCYLVAVTRSGPIVW